MSWRRRLSLNVGKQCPPPPPPALFSFLFFPHRQPDTGRMSCLAGERDENNPEEVMSCWKQQQAQKGEGSVCCRHHRAMIWSQRDCADLVFPSCSAEQTPFLHPWKRRPTTTTQAAESIGFFYCISSQPYPKSRAGMQSSGWPVFGVLLSLTHLLSAQRGGSQQHGPVLEKTEP